MNSFALFFLVAGTTMTAGSAFVPFPSLLGFIGVTLIIAALLVMYGSHLSVEARARLARRLRAEAASLDQHRNS